MEKSEFLTNIAHRLSRQPGQSPSPRTSIGVPDFWSDRNMAEDELLERFSDRFTAQGGELITANSTDALLQKLEKCLSELQPTDVGAWGRTANWAVDVHRVLDKWSAMRFDEATASQFAAVQVSITGCAYAVADTGTVVMMSSPAQGRGAHILPPVHIVVMDASQIRLRLGEIFDEVTANDESLPASVHFVSGPSRSSDIENDQSVGVHGPARVIAFVLDS